MRFFGNCLLMLLALVAECQSVPERPSLAKPFIEAGKDFKKGHYAEAARFYREIMVTYEGSDWEAKGALFLGQCLEAMGKRGQAMEVYHKLAEKYANLDEGVEAAFRLAGIAEAAGDGLEAEKWYQKLMATGSARGSGALATLNLANLQARTKKTKEALQTFSRLASDYPDNAWATREAQMGRAKIFRATKDYAGALSVYQAAADKILAGPAKAQILMSLGHCALEARDNTRAASSYQKVAVEYPDWQPVALFYLGQAQQQAGRTADALQTFERLEIKHPKTMWGIAARARRAEMLGPDEDAGVARVPGGSKE